jgi:hypothetical protein
MENLQKSPYQLINNRKSIHNGADKLQAIRLISNPLNHYQDAKQMNFFRMDFSPVVLI